MTSPLSQQLYPTAAPSEQAGSNIPKSLIQAKGDLVVGESYSTPAVLQVGVNGEVPFADSSAPLGIRWGVMPEPGIPASIFNAKGDLIVARYPDSPGILSVGSDGKALIANSSIPLGMEWGSILGEDISGTYVDAGLTMTSGRLLGRTSGSIGPAEQILMGGGLTLYGGYLDTSPFIQAGGGAVARTITSKLQDTVSVKDFGAVGDGTTNDSPAFTNAIAASLNVNVPEGEYYLFSDVTVPSAHSLNADLGVTFTGFGSIIATGTVRDYGVTGVGPRRVLNERYQFLQSFDTAVNAKFGTCQVRAAAGDNCDGIVGTTLQTGPDNGSPAGVIGYGKQSYPGNKVFGVFGQADLYEYGVATNELNTFNYKSAPSGTLPPDTAFGIAESVPITLTVAAGGDYQSSIGIRITGATDNPQSYLCGIYMDPAACTDYGLFIAATSTSGAKEAIHADFGGSIENSFGLALQYKNAAPSTTSRFIVCKSQTNSVKFYVKTTGKVGFGTGLTQLTVGPEGLASVLPAKPTGYLVVEIEGEDKVIPYYEPV